MKIVVLHRGYECETGCCGHIIEVDGEQVGEFNFDHPGGVDRLEFARNLVRNELGEAHVADLDWANCQVVDD